MAIPNAFWYLSVAEEIILTNMANISKINRGICAVESAVTVKLHIFYLMGIKMELFYHWSEYLCRPSWKTTSVLQTISDFGHLPMPGCTGIWSPMATNDTNGPPSLTNGRLGCRRKIPARTHLIYGVVILFTVVQDRVVFVWFWDKLALAFGIITSTLRIGSVLNFLVTSKVSLDYGLSWALWLGMYLSLFVFFFL